MENDNSSQGNYGNLNVGDEVIYTDISGVKFKGVIDKFYVPFYGTGRIKLENETFKDVIIEYCEKT